MNLFALIIGFPGVLIVSHIFSIHRDEDHMHVIEIVASLAYLAIVISAFLQDTPAIRVIVRRDRGTDEILN